MAADGLRAGSLTTSCYLSGQRPDNGTSAPGVLSRLSSETAKRIAV